MFLRCQRMWLRMLCLMLPCLGHGLPATASEPVRGSSSTSVENAPVIPGATEIAPAISIAIGKSMLVPLTGRIERISVGNPSVADVMLIAGRELYLLGKTFGATNVIIWRRDGPTTLVDVNVAMDATSLQLRLRQLLPAEPGIVVDTAADAVVLSGKVSSALQADYAVSIAEAFARSYSRGFALPITAGDTALAPGQPIAVTTVQQRALSGAAQQAQLRVINLMRVEQPQQVMLEVKVAEISRNLLDKLGVSIDGARISGDWRFSILSGFLSSGGGVLGLLSRTGNAVNIDAEKRDGLLRILAEPNIVAMSGQEASFLAGGRIFIPVSRTSTTNGLATISLEEKEFGVGLKFTPTVLDGGRINLRVSPEVSELSQTGASFTTVGGVTTVLPSFSTRRAQTTVQLMDGQSFAIAGLIKNNLSESVRRFPVLGEVPVLGALFRSSDFQADRSELMFIVTPRLVRPLDGGQPAAPGENFIAPSRSDFLLRGRLEGEAPAGRPGSPSSGRPSGGGGFELR